MYEWFLVFVVVIALYLAFRLLHLASQATAPRLFCTPSAFNSRIIHECPLLSEPYIPPLLWGKSGHVQTVIYGKLGRVNSPFPQGDRILMAMPDGATSTFDVFEPLDSHPSGGDFTIVICPGIANSSESLYICTCVHYAQTHGYRVAVLNHLGALKNVPLTAPRIFTYGGTEEYGAMIDELHSRYPLTHLIATGFSMGANIVLKYVGESKEQQDKVIGAMSFCQGYDVQEAMKACTGWENMERAYIFAMTLAQKRMLQNHREVLFGPDATLKIGEFDEDEIFKVTSIPQLDEIYSRRRAGFDSLDDYYIWSSSKNHMHNIEIPTLIVNSEDDPLINPKLLTIPEKFAMSRDNVIFAVTRHGGHLGFFEGGIFQPETITWLDKMVVQYADALVTTTGSSLHQSHIEKLTSV